MPSSTFGAKAQTATDRNMAPSYVDGCLEKERVSRVRGDGVGM